MIIELDKTLKPLDNYRYHRDKEDIRNRTIPAESRQKSIYNRQTKEYDYTSAKEVVISSSFAAETPLVHANYSEYLCQAYAEHKKIVITPDIIWHTIMSETAQAVVADPKPYGTLFTTDPDKKTSILVPTDSVDNLPMDKLMLGLKALIPNDTSMFFPGFSTTTELALLAQQAAFAEMCTPYYNYMTFCCGYPAIDIQGIRSDYVTITDKLIELLTFFDKVTGSEIITSYYLKVLSLMYAFLRAYDRQDVDFFKNILYTKNCGSGGEIECLGWWVQNMFLKDHSKTKPENLPSVISRVPYKNLETNRKFALNCGLFYSIDENGFSVPQWGWVKNELAEPSEENQNANSKEQAQISI